MTYRPEYQAKPHETRNPASPLYESAKCNQCGVVIGAHVAYWIHRTKRTLCPNCYWTEARK